MKVVIESAAIALDAFLKWANVTASGGEAKAIIQGGRVSVNGEVERRRKRKVRPGDVVTLEGLDEELLAVQHERP